jgi:hypothetical protein
VTLPVFILIGEIMEVYLRDKHFEIRQPLFEKRGG